MSSSPLSELPEYWLVDVLRLLDCRSLLQFLRTSTANRLLAAETIDTTASASSFLSSAPTLMQAFSEIVSLCLSRLSSPPSLAFLFLSPTYPAASLPAALSFLSKLLPPHCRLLGCHGTGIIGRDVATSLVREVENPQRAVTISFLHLPQVQLTAQFLDIKALTKYLTPPAPQPALVPQPTPAALPAAASTAAVAVPSTDSEVDWLAEVLSLSESERDAASSGPAPSFVVLSSPVRLVSDFLQAMHRIAPRSFITGALASGGRQSTVGLFTKEGKGPVTAHCNGIAVLSLRPQPPSSPAAAAAAAPSSPSSVRSISPHASPLAAPVTGFASRGCKACSGVYQILAASDNVIAEVKEVQSLPVDDGGEDPLLHPAVLERLMGPDWEDAALARDRAAAEREAWQRAEPEQAGEAATGGGGGRPGAMVSEARPMEMLDVLREVMQRCSQGQDGYINGLFIGVSEQCESQQGRLLCDIAEVQREGIRIDSHSYDNFPLVGRFLQFFELDPAACMLDLANRIRPLARLSPAAAAAAASSSSPSAQLLSSLLFTCSGRGRGFFNRPNIDSSIAAHQSGVDVCGFFCNGEIGPPARSLQVQSWMQREREGERTRTRKAASTRQTTQASSSLDDDEQDEEEEQEEAAEEERPQWREAPHSEEEEGDDRLGLDAAGDGVVLPPTCCNEPAVLQSFTAVVALFKSQW